MGKTILYPLDTASFRKIRENGFVYVDKTGYIETLTKSKGTYYFLARPRRFGKSLFLDTLAEYFSGNRALFNGLAIDSLHTEEWERYPVLRINLTGKDYSEAGSLLNHITDQLQALEDEYGLEHSSSEFEGRFGSLIKRASQAAGKRVVILVDEYDAPLSSTIDNPDLQETYRSQLHGFYSVLKKEEEYIRFCFLTGVTRYGKVSVFSGLNNLNDITFDDEYAGICGVTEKELYDCYCEGVEALAAGLKTSKEEIYEKLKHYYDGYHFSKSLLDVYNPYSLNHVLSKGEFKDYWCRSGVPTLLSKTLMLNDFDVESLNGKKVLESELTYISMFNANPVSLFYQTGYLTIKSYEERRQRYVLGYPNREVEGAIMSNILKVYTHSIDERRGVIFDMEDALEEGNPKEFIRLLKAFLSDIPNQLHKHVARYENYYHTIFYCLTTLIGLDVEAEYSTSEGFIDILINTGNYVYIIELKVNGTAEDAIKQIEEKHYDAPFVDGPRKPIKIGIGFSRETHNISSYLIM